MQKRQHEKVVKSKVAAQKWLWWSHFRWILVPIPSWRRQHKFTWNVVIKFLPLSDHHSCFCVDIIGLSDFPVMYTHTPRPAALKLGCTYQANHEGRWYNWYVLCWLIAHALMQADSLLWANNHLSQHKVNYWISYIDSSVEFDHGLKHTRNVC